MSEILLIDKTRTFLDDRACLKARNIKQALTLLEQNEGKLKSIWIDSDFGTAPDGIKPLLDYFILRSKIGNPYPVNVFCIHAPTEQGWQLLSSKLKGFGYNVFRATINDTLG